MNRVAFSLLMPGLVLAPVLCRAAEPAADQARAVAAIQELRGTIEVDEKSPDKTVVGAVLRGPDTTDAAMEYIAGFTRLKRLYLDDTEVTDAGFGAP